MCPSPSRANEDTVRPSPFASAVPRPHGSGWAVPCGQPKGAESHPRSQRQQRPDRAPHASKTFNSHASKTFNSMEGPIQQSAVQGTSHFGNGLPGASRQAIRVSGRRFWRRQSFSTSRSTASSSFSSHSGGSCRNARSNTVPGQVIARVSHGSKSAIDRTSW